MIYIIMLLLAYGLLKVVCSIMIFPAQFLKNPSYDLEKIKKDFPDLEFITSEEKTPEKRRLATIRIQPSTNTIKEIILIFNGQNATFRNEKKVRTYSQLAKDTGCMVIGFDYGGTALRRITTWNYQPLIKDGVFLAKKLAKSFPDYSLIIKGNSLGGAISTITVKECHEAGILAYLWNGRSFVSAADVVAGQLRTLHLSGHYENKITMVISNIARPVISGLLRVSGWNIDVENAYKSIPDVYKNYYLVRSKKSERALKKDDMVIPYCASLESRPAIKQSVKERIKTGNKNNCDDIAFYRARRKCYARFPNNAHPLPEIDIFCREKPKLSAYGLFCLFATVYVPNHKANNNIINNQERKSMGEPSKKRNMINLSYS